ILSMDLSTGGHLSHGSNLHFAGKNFKVINYGVDENGDIDYTSIESSLKNNDIKILIAGASSYPREINWAKLRQIINRTSPKTIFMADIAHTAGLVAGNAFPSPFGY